MSIVSNVSVPSNYQKFRGKCKVMCENLVASDPTLTLCRGYYHDAFWGKQPHWWCTDANGEVVDPSKLQFPDQNGTYELFDGVVYCAQCQAPMKEEEVRHFYGNYAFCSPDCLMKFVL